MEEILKLSLVMINWSLCTAVITYTIFKYARTYKMKQTEVYQVLKEIVDDINGHRYIRAINFSVDYPDRKPDPEHGTVTPYRHYVRIYEFAPNIVKLHRIYKVYGYEYIEKYAKHLGFSTGVNNDLDKIAAFEPILFYGHMRLVYLPLCIEDFDTLLRFNDTVDVKLPIGSLFDRNIFMSAMRANINNGDCNGNTKKV